MLYLFNPRLTYFMKGSVEELFYIIVIFISFLFLFLFLTSERTKEGKEVRKAVEERILTEELLDFSKALFNNKVPFSEKRYIQSLIDGILRGSKEYVYYGKGIGSINLTGITEQLISQYAKDRIKIEISIGNKKYEWGEIRGKILYTYETLIPIPDERLGRLIIYLSE